MSSITKKSQKSKITLALFSCAAVACTMSAGLLAPTPVWAAPLASQYDVASMQDLSTRHGIGNQGQSQLCWAYSSAKAVETYIYKQYSKAYNLSEEWVSLAYQNYVHDDEFTLITNPSNGVIDSVDYSYGDIGHVYLFERAINAYGIMEEKDFQKPASVTDQNFQALFTDASAKAQTDVLNGLAFRWIGYTPSSSAPLAAYGSQSTSALQRDYIVNDMKTYLTQHGSLVTSINAQSITSDGQGGFFVYHSTTESLTHGMSIIGYDDTKQVTVAPGQTLTGAFKLLNSYGSSQQVVYMPYDMFLPNIVSGPDGKSEANLVLSNTFYINALTAGPALTNPDSGDGDGTGTPTTPPDGGEQGGTTPDEGEGDGDGTGGTGTTTPDGGEDGSEGGEVTPPDGGEEAPAEPAKPLWETLMAKPLEEQIIVFAAAGLFAIFLLIGIFFGITALARKRATSALNQNVLAHNFARYQAHRLELERQKAALDEELEKIRAEQKRKKQRRLKREFNKKLNTGNQGQPEE